MQVQVVRAATRQLALSEARRRLGPDPLVLAVRRQPATDGNGFEWEAVVARDTPAPQIATPPSPPAKTTVLAEVDALRLDLATIAGAQGARPRGADLAGASTHDLLAIARRLSQLETGLLETLLAGKQLAAHWVPLLDRLDGAGYPRAEAIALLQQVEAKSPAKRDGTTLEPAMLHRRFRHALASSVAVAPAEERVRPGLVVFVGSSGVGKTTLSAKLVADLCLGGSRRPVIGAILPKGSTGTDTLKRAARALDIEYTEVTDSTQLLRLAERAHQVPVVLDAASVNPRSDQGLEELRKLLGAAPSAEIHAVVPASHSLSDFAVSTSAFGLVGAKRLAVTRLDEAPMVGRVLAAATAARMPISYVSQGPRIPDDLVRPALESLLDAVLANEGAR
jgi:hypothetical protein